MKKSILIFAVFFAAAFCRAGTPILIHQETVTRDTPNSDDFFAIDGATSGTAKTHANEYVRTNGSYADPSWIPSFAWSKISAPPTTLAGYGITDAQPLSSNLTAFSSKVAPTGAVVGTTDTQTLTNKSIDAAQLTGSIAAGRYAATTVPVSAVNASGTASSSTFLRGDGAWATPSGAGTVTSVGATVPSFLSVSGSPITGAGTLAVSYSGTPLPVANGGTGTTTPGLVQGSNVTITGTWPNQTINSTGGSGSGNDEIGFGADGGGSVVTTGLRAKRVMEYACTITGWGIVADQSGSIVMDIRKGTPSGGTVTTSTITGSATPALSSAQVATSTTLTGWTTAVAAGDVLELVVTGTPAALTVANLTLKITRP